LSNNRPIQRQNYYVITNEAQKLNFFVNYNVTQAQGWSPITITHYCSSYSSSFSVLVVVWRYFLFSIYFVCNNDSATHFAGHYNRYLIGRSHAPMHGRSLVHVMRAGENDWSHRNHAPPRVEAIQGGSGWVLRWSYSSVSRNGARVLYDLSLISDRV
jgi:hypothetical protein